MTWPDRIALRDTTFEELDQIAAMEQGEAQEFILPYAVDRHHAEFARAEVLYKSVWSDDQLAGFIIVVLDPDGVSLELRRIVIARPGRGHGKRAVCFVDQIARELGRSRIWLDVFDGNARARHVYEACGYRRFGAAELDGRRLLFYEKTL